MYLCANITVNPAAAPVIIVFFIAVRSACNMCVLEIMNNNNNNANISISCSTDSSLWATVEREKAKHGQESTKCN